MILSRICRGSSSCSYRVMISVGNALKIESLNKRLGFVRSTMSLKHQFCSETTMTKNYEHFYGKNTKDAPREKTSKNLATQGSHLAMHLPPTKGLSGVDEYPKSKSYNLEEEAKRRPDSDLLTPRSHYSEKGMGRQDEDLTSIERGDIINLPELLFTKNRDYLVKYNSDEKVKAEQLAGKVIVILFISLAHDLYLDERESITFLTDIYSELYPKGCFEVIFVAIDDADEFSNEKALLHSCHSHKYFENVFSRMPWCAIPFSEPTSRKRLEKRFGVTGDSPAAYVVDSKGMVLNCHACLEFRRYGTLGYPFTKQRIQLLKSEDDKATKQPSLQTLLGSPERDYLISNKGEKVPIHTLEDKVVALYFYEDGITDDEITIKLVRAYKELAKKEEKFEVVLLYLYDTHGTFDCTDKESFTKKFETMPWLALPFKDPNHKKLKRIFYYPWDVDSSVRVPTLVIFGPHGEFVDPCGADILMNFELAAYPFTRKKLAKLHSEKMKELKLEKLWDQITVFRGKDGSQVPFSQLAGKKIVAIFQKNQQWKPAKALEMLGDSYRDMKGSCDEFEVIHIRDSSCDSEFDFNLPWGVQYFGEGYSLSNELLSCVFGFYPYRSHKAFSGCSLLAFDQKGNLVRRKLCPTLEDMDSPFRAGCMEKETMEQLNNVYRWYLWDLYICSSWGQIYKGKF